MMRNTNLHINLFCRRWALFQGFYSVSISKTFKAFKTFSSHSPLKLSNLFGSRFCPWLKRDSLLLELVYGEYMEQECPPVGCVPSVAVAVCPGVVSGQGGVYLARGYLLDQGVYTPPWTDTLGAILDVAIFLGADSGEFGRGPSS